MSKLTKTPGNLINLANNLTEEWFTKTYSCSECDMTMTDPEKWSSHELNSHQRTFCEAFCDEHIDSRGCPRLWTCHCGTPMTTSKKLIQHIRTAHMNHVLDYTQIKEFLARGYTAQGYETNKALNQTTEKRQFLLAHQPQRKLKKVFLNFFPERRVRMFHKAPRTMSEISVEIYGTHRTFLYNERENNQALLHWIGLALAQGIARPVGVGQTFDWTWQSSIFTIGVDAEGAMEKIMSAGSWLTAVILFAVACHRAPGTRPLLIGAMCCALVSDRRNRAAVSKAAYNILGAICLDGNVFKPSGQGVSEQQGFIVSVFTLVCIIGFGFKPKDGMVDRLAKKANDFGFLAKNLTMSWTLVEKLFDFFREQGLTEIFGFDPDPKSAALFLESIQEFRDEVEVLEAQQNLFASDARFCRRAIDANRRFQALYATLKASALPNSVLVSLANVGLRLNKMESQARGSGAMTSGGRIEPAVICFHGGSGLGKSHLAIMLAAKLSAIYCPNAESWLREVYVRNVSQEFWDSYHGQFVVMYDDFGQLVDSSTKPNQEFIELIKCQNYTDYPLHMADIKDKNSTYFQSRAIILTTNLEHGKIRPRSLSSAEALNRRIELSYTVEKIDESIMDIRPSNYRFKRHANGQTTIVTMDEVLKEYVELINTKEERFTELNARLTTMDDSLSFANFEKAGVIPPPPLPAEESIDEEHISRLEGALASSTPLGQGVWQTVRQYWMMDAELILCSRTEALGIASTDFGAVLTFAHLADIPEDKMGTMKVGSFYWKTTYHILSVPVDKKVCLQSWIGPDRLFFCRARELSELEKWVHRAMRLAGLLSLAKIALDAGSYLLKATSAEEGPVLDLDHKGLEVGERVKHAHRCSACDRIFHHTHEIQHPSDEYARGPSLCKGCRGPIKTMNNWIYSDDEGRRYVGGGHHLGSRLLPSDGNPERIKTEGLTPERPPVEEYDAGATPYPKRPTVERYDGGSTPYPKRPTVERYDAGSTQHPKRPAVEGAAAPKTERYDAGRTPYPKRPTVEGLSEDNFKGLGCTLIEAITALRNLLDFDIWDRKLELNWHDLPTEDQNAWDAFFGTAHRTRVALHRRYVYDAFKCSGFSHLTPEVAGLHDWSKFSLIEMAGYTFKWHFDPSSPVAKEFDQKERDRLWDLAWKHHTEHNSHHPDSLPMDLKDLEEAVCDMMAMAMEKKGFKLDGTTNGWWDQINEENGRYMQRFSKNQRELIRQLLLPTGEMVMDNNAMQVTLNVEKNLFMMLGSYETEPQTWHRIQNCFFLKNKIAFCNVHSMTKVKSFKWIQLVRADGKVYNVETRRIMYQAYRTTRTADLGILIFPKEIPDFRDMTDHFLSAKDLAKAKITPATLICLTRTASGQVSNTRFVTTAQIEAKRAYVAPGIDGQNTSYDAGMTWVYRAETVAGDCGSVLCASNPALATKLMGFHTWGFVNREAGSIVVTKEDLEAVMRQCIPHGQGSLPVRPIEHLASIWETTFYPAGQADPPKSSSKSAIRKSCLHDTYAESKTMPAMLKPNDDFDPMLNGRLKYNNSATPVPHDYVSRAKSSVQQKIYGNGPERDNYTRVLTEDEAVAGVEGIPFMDSINRTTAAGYPWGLEKGAKGKKHLIDENMKMRADLRSAVEKRVDAAKKGERTETIWTDTLKDERRPKEKVRKGKTRVFTASPVDYTIALRMFTLGFCAFAMAGRVYNGMAVGINPYAEWHHLAQKLQTKGTNFVAGDFAQFDGTMRADALQAALEVVEEFYLLNPNHTREDRRACQTLMQEVLNSLHIGPDGNLYYDDHGDPSGCSLTAIINSIYNMIMTRVVWQMLTPRPLMEFDDNVAEIYYGDDNVFGISDEVIEEFNQHTLTQAFATMNITYTSEDKTDNAPKFRKLEEVTFLKRAFRWEDKIHQFVGPLALDTILEIPMWIKTSLNVAQQECDNVETALKELSLHGEEVYDYWVMEIRKEMWRMRSLPEMQPWRDAFEDVTNQKPGLGQGGITVIDLQQILNPGSSVEEEVEGKLPIGQCALPAIKATDPVRGPDGVMLPPEDGTKCIAAMEKEIGLIQKPDEEEIVTFQQEAEPPVADEIPREILEDRPFAEDRTHTLIDVLERPYQMDVVSWTQGAQAGDILQGIKPKTQLQTFANFASKLRQFAFWRANFKIKVMINSQRFQVGKLLIAAFPDSGKFSLDSGDRTARKFQASTMRHVEIDVGTNEVAEIELPFYGDKDVWDVGVNPFDWNVWVLVLNPLDGSTTGETIDITTFIQAQNVEVFMPASGVGQGAQANTKPTGVMRCGDKVEQIPMGQGNTEGEAKSKEGLISGPARTISNVAGALSGIPFLSDVAGPVSWISGAVGKVATAFGFSKPVSQESNKRMTLVPASGYTNTEGLDNAVVMGFKPDNEVKQANVEDELELNQITSKWGLISTHDWQFSDPVNFTITSWLVTPLIATQFSPKHFYMSPLMYVAQFFRLWRGSITYRLSFAKNAFYSGKLLVTFSPNKQTEPIPAEHNDLYRQVLTLKDANDFEITIPYVANSTWKSCVAGTTDVSTGVVTVSVLNRLQSAETVPSSIQFNVWHCSTDIKFAVPATVVKPMSLRYEPPTPRDLPVGQGAAPANDGSVQVLNMFEMRGSPRPEEHTIGEEISSIRQLTRRFTLFAHQISSLVIGSWVPRDKEAQEVTHFSYKDALSMPFLFMTGGSNWKYWCPGEPNGLLFAQQTNSNLGTKDVVYEPHEPYNGAEHLVPCLTTPVIELKTPYYSLTPRRFVDTAYPTTQRLNVGVIDKDFVIGTNISSRLYWAGADDFNLSTWIAAPFLIDGLY